MRRVPQRLCGEVFGEEGLRAVREVIGQAAGCRRAEIARRVCDRLGWRNERGGRKEVGARVAVLRLHRAGWIELPAARNGNGSAQALRVSVPWPAGEPLEGSVEGLAELRLERVTQRATSCLWNALIERHHYLRGWRLSGHQVRYLIVWQGGILGALGFGAAALKVAVRDQWIGWNAEQREQQRRLVVNNRRVLILPWVRVRNLASRVLSLAARAVVRDYQQLYGIRPVLLESFIEAHRFTGSSYRAANWQCLGHSAGRGRGDREHRQAVAPKALYVYALARNFRRVLTGAGR